MMFEWLAEEYDDLGARLFVVLGAGLLFNLGFTFYLSMAPLNALNAAGIVILYGAGGLLLYAVLTNLDIETHGDRLGWLMLGAIVLGTICAMVDRDFIAVLGTDAMAFSKLSAMMVMNGTNPYAASMEPALNLSGYPHSGFTPRIDGSMATSLSYPAGSVVPFLPAQILGIQLRYVSVAAAAAIGCLLVWDLPSRYAIVGPIALLAPTNFLAVSAGGIFDPLWVLPMLLSLRAVHHERWLWAGALLGAAASVKQQPWIAGPFLAVFFYRSASTWRGGIRRFATASAGAVGVFIAVNLPFILWGPTAWLRSVFTPVAGGAPMVQTGNGLTIITMTGLVPLPTSWYTMAVGFVVLWSLAAYVLYFQQLQYVAWLMPAIVLFFHYRSLSSYFTMFIPIAVYGTLVLENELHGEWPSLNVIQARARAVIKS